MCIWTTAIINIFTLSVSGLTLDVRTDVYRRLQGSTLDVRISITPYSAKIFLQKPLKPKGYYHFEIIINVFVYLFLVHLNTYVIGLHTLEIF